MQLDPIQLRVLGSLIEKEITTPENYPLSLNALVNACNQRSSRDPVLELTEEDVRQALHALEDLALATPVHDARVPKYEHRIRTVLNLRRDETAILCLLILRGPQTPGELRGRADRLFTFDDLAAVNSTLERLAARPPSDETTPKTPAHSPSSSPASLAHAKPATPTCSEPHPTSPSPAQTGAKTERNRPPPPSHESPNSKPKSPLSPPRSRPFNPASTA